MQDLAITAIIPLYNGAEFIEEALNSVLGQTLAPAKIIVVDDGSTDDGVKIVSRIAHDHNIYLIQKQNGGQSSARNLGIAHSQTPLIALLDQDDVWYPHHLEHLIKPFREIRYPELGWVYSNLDEIDREGRMVTRSCLDLLPTIQHPKRSLTGCLATDMFAVPTSTLINRRAFEAIGGFDERLIGYEDDDLFLRMFRNGYDNVYLNDALAKWRIFPSSSSHSPRMRQSRMIYLRKLLQTFPPNDRLGQLYWRSLLAPRFFPMLVNEYYQASQGDDANAVRATVDDLKVLLPYLPRRTRLVLQTVLPMMARRSPARLAANLAERNFPLIKRLFRVALG
jgi:glycosyltransferase involved in cell wall biosynthesis